MKFLKLLLFFVLGMNLVYAQKIPVIASFSVLADITEQVGGERISVTSIVGYNQDAHVYQLTPNDIKKIQASRLLVLNGLGFEGASFNRVGKIKTVVATKGIRALSGGDHGNDPHAFNSPVLVKIYAQNIANALIEIDPKGKDYYNKRLISYLKSLTALDNWAKKTISAVPAEKRKVLTAHDAFGYLGKQYGIQFIAPQGVNTDSEASAKTVASIIKQTKTLKIKAIFAENIKDARLINQISKETGAKVVGKLYSDSLGTKNTVADTYIKMMQFNINALANAMK